MNKNEQQDFTIFSLIVPFDIRLQLLHKVFSPIYLLHKYCNMIDKNINCLCSKCGNYKIMINKINLKEHDKIWKELSMKINNK
jgi:hypothetical protein